MCEISVAHLHSLLPLYNTRHMNRLKHHKTKYGLLSRQQKMIRDNNFQTKSTRILGNSFACLDLEDAYNNTEINTLSSITVKRKEYYKIKLFYKFHKTFFRFMSNNIQWINRFRYDWRKIFVFVWRMTPGKDNIIGGITELKMT